MAPSKVVGWNCPSGSSDHCALGTLCYCPLSLATASPSLCGASRLLRHSSCAVVCLLLACFISYQDTWTSLVEGFQLFTLRGFQRKSPGELLTTWKTRLDLARAPMPGSVGWHCLLKLCVLAKGLEGAGLGSQGSRGPGVQRAAVTGVRAFPTPLTSVCLVTSEGLF